MIGAMILHNHFSTLGMNAPMEDFTSPSVLFCYHNLQIYAPLRTEYIKSDHLPSFGWSWVKRFNAKYNFSFQKPTTLTKHAHADLLPSILIFIIKLLTMLLTNRYDLDLVFNADETPINKAYHPGKMVSRKGVPRHVKAVSGDKARVTLMLAVSLVGEVLKPYVVAQSKAEIYVKKVTDYVFDNTYDVLNFTTPMPKPTTTVHSYATIGNDVNVGKFSHVTKSSVAHGLAQMTDSQSSSSEVTADSQSRLSTKKNAKKKGNADFNPTNKSQTNSNRDVKNRRKVNGGGESPRNGPEASIGGLDSEPKASVGTMSLGATAWYEPMNMSPTYAMTLATKSQRPGKRTIFLNNKHAPVEFAKLNQVEVENFTKKVVNNESVSLTLGRIVNAVVSDSESDDDSDTEEVSPYRDPNSHYEDTAVGQVMWGASNLPEIMNIINDFSLELKTIHELIDILKDLYVEFQSFIGVIDGKVANNYQKFLDEKNFQDSMFVSKNENAWFTTDIMIDWIEKVVLPRRTDPNKRILLLLDCFSVHRKQEVVNYCLSKNIDIVFIPANCTGHLQPIDISLNRTIKDFLRAVTIGRIFTEFDDSGHRQHDGKYMNEDRFLGIIQESVNMINPLHVVHGFNHMMYNSTKDRTKNKKRNEANPIISDISMFASK